MARTRLNLRRLACAALASLLSLLSFVVVLHPGPRRSAGDGDAHTTAAALLIVRLVDAETEQRMPPLFSPEADRPLTISADHATAAGHGGPAVAIRKELEYVPAAALSERPVLLKDIDTLIDLASVGIAGPEMPSLPEVTGVLLINEQGGVDHLQFESGALPHYLEAILAQRFADARFTPGKINGKPVPSALRIALRL